MGSDRAVVLGLALAVGAVSAAQGQVFKCTDTEGKVTYTDVPCLQSEKSAVVDTRSNVADNGSLRQAAARLQNSPPVSTPQGSAQAASPAPAQPQRVLKDFVQRGSY